MIEFVLIPLFALCVLLAWAYAQLQRDYRALLAKGRARDGQPLLPPSFFQSRRDLSQREYAEGLDRLGFNSREEYERSEHWRAKKQEYRRSAYPQRCLVCGATDFVLHHRTYERLGREELFDLVPLCQPHHEALHQLLDLDPDLSVKDTHDYLARLLERPVDESTGTVAEVPNDSEIPF